MKTAITIIITAIASSCATYYAVLEELKDKYNNYISSSEELLWEIEEMCNYHNICWGDTVCEGNNWDDYCDARESLGLDFLVHWSKKGE